MPPMRSNLRQAWLAFSRTPAGRAPHQRLVAGIELARRVEMMDRPRWLYRPAGSLPEVEFHFVDPLAVTDADLRLSERLIAAYAAATAATDAPQGMWGEDLFRDRQRAILEPLERQDAPALAGALAEVFRSDVVLGMAAGSMGTREQSKLSRRVSWLDTLGKIVALGEAIGAVRVENPEQGNVGEAFSAGASTVIEAIQETLGFSIDFPNVGAPYGVSAAGTLVTPDAPDQIYAAKRLSDAISLHLPDRAEPSIIEIGGGYGGMAFWLLQMRESPYTIIDLPIVGVLQGYFLAKALGPDSVRLHGEAPGPQVSVLPDHELASIDGPVDVVVNKDSLPEIPLFAARGYLEWTRQHCDGLFYSYNQEAAAEFHGTRQNVVPELIRELGGSNACAANRRGCDEATQRSSTSARQADRRRLHPDRVRSVFTIERTRCLVDCPA